MVTYPGLPGPEITAHLTFEASKEVYASGTTFEISTSGRPNTVRPNTLT